MAGPPGRRSRLQLPNYGLSILPPLPHPWGRRGPQPSPYSRPTWDPSGIIPWGGGVWSSAKIEKVEGGLRAPPIPRTCLESLKVFDSQTFFWALDLMSPIYAQVGARFVYPSPSSLPFQNGGVMKKNSRWLWEQSAQNTASLSPKAVSGTPRRKKYIWLIPQESPSSRHWRQSTAPWPCLRQFGLVVY